MIILAAAAAFGSSGPPATPDQAIIVTGERSKRLLKDTFSSVHVETRKDIEARPADRVEDVLAFVPNVQLGHGSEGPAIRGQDTTGALQALPAFLGGNRPRTTLVVDGRAQTYSEFVFGAAPVWDVDRIEVFRSPQTTTQGQNSIAGAIFVYTADPTFEPEYRLRGIVGDFKTRQLSAVASAPLSNAVALRVAGDFRYSRTTTHIVDVVERGDPNHDVYGLLRAKLLVEPEALPNTRMTVTYVHDQSQSPQIVQTTAPYRERRDERGGYGVFRINSDSLTAAVRHSGGTLTAEMVVSAGDSSANRLAPPGFGQAFNRSRDWSAEAVTNWAPRPFLHVTGGVSRRHMGMRQKIDLSVFAGIPQFSDRQDGTGVFGEASLELGLATVTGGIRYQRDGQKRIGGFDTAAGRVELDYDRSFHAWLPKLSLSYRLSPQVTAGLLIEKAYNPGGTTLRFDVGQPDNFEAEKLWDYEGYIRATMAGGTLVAQGNAFYYDMRNAQRSKAIAIEAPNGRLAGFADLFNIPKARTYGLEGEMRWNPSQRLSASVGLGLLRTKILKSGADYPEFQGNEFDRAPHLTASAAVDWRPVERLQLSAQVRHHSGYWSVPSEDPLSRVGSGTIAGARAEYRFGASSLFAYARNVFDRFGFVTRDGSSVTVEEPREVGFGVETRF